MFCRRCGQQLSEDMSFCLNCGTPVSFTDNAPQPEPPVQNSGLNDTARRADSAKPKKKHTLRTVLIITGCVLAVCAVLIPVLINKNLNDRYENACSLLDRGDTEQAKAVFSELGGFKDAKDMILACDYSSGEELMNSGSFEEAKAVFATLGDYEDADKLSQECQNTLDYNHAIELKDGGEAEQARDIFLQLGTYEDAETLAQDCQNMLDYEQATGLLDQGSYQDAKAIFDALGSYSDAMLCSATCQNNIDYAAADTLYNNGEFYEAYKIFQNMDSFKDNYDRASACIQPNPENGELYRNADYGKKSCALTIKNGSSTDSVYVKIYTPENVLVSAVFINAGQKAKVKLPSGSYRFKKAMGIDWFGETDMYGDEGYYELLIFKGGADVTGLSSSRIYTLSFAVEGEGNINGEQVGVDGF